MYQILRWCVALAMHAISGYPEPSPTVHIGRIPKRLLHSFRWRFSWNLCNCRRLVDLPWKLLGKDRNEKNQDLVKLTNFQGFKHVRCNPDVVSVEQRPGWGEHVSTVSTFNMFQLGDTRDTKKTHGFWWVFVGWASTAFSALLWRRLGRLQVSGSPLYWLIGIPMGFPWMMILPMDSKKK